jgi:hypothetical protein
MLFADRAGVMNRSRGRTASHVRALPAVRQIAVVQAARRCSPMA